MKFRNLSIIFFIIVYLLAMELALEYRAKERNFNTLLLGRKNNLQQPQKNNKEPFPFRSPVIELDKPTDNIRIWMASASYAEDTKRSIEELFPNIICEKIGRTRQPCQMLNAAKAGYTINDNIKQLKNNVKKWKPDYVLLYSMNLDITKLSNRFLGLNAHEPTENETDNTNKIHTTNLSFGERIEKTVEQMTVYGHLRRYIGGEVLLSTLLHDDIGLKANDAFKQTLQKFIQTSNKFGVKPILVTFATQYNINNYNRMTHDENLARVRYNEHLSNKGWVKTVKDFNKVIRQTAIENNVPYIDLAKEIGGKKVHFTDFVHFTKDGHKIVGEYLAEELIRIIYAIKDETP